MSHVQDRCREYAVITEPLNGLRLVVCGLNGFHRQQHVYTSRSNVVRLQMAAWPRHTPLSTSASGSDVTSARYVIHYEGNSPFYYITRLGGTAVCTSGLVTLKIRGLDGRYDMRLSLQYYNYKMRRNDRQVRSASHCNAFFTVRAMLARY